MDETSFANCVAKIQLERGHFDSSECKMKFFKTLRITFLVALFSQWTGGQHTTSYSQDGHFDPKLYK